MVGRLRSCHLRRQLAPLDVVAGLNRPDEQQHLGGVVERPQFTAQISQLFSAAGTGLSRGGKFPQPAAGVLAGWAIGRVGIDRTRVENLVSAQVVHLDHRIATGHKHESADPAAVGEYLLAKSV